METGDLVTPTILAGRTEGTRFIPCEYYPRDGKYRRANGTANR